MKWMIGLCALMVVAGVAFALSVGRGAWPSPFGFCLPFPLLIVAGLMGLAMLACVLFRHVICRRAGASCRSCSPSRS